jgi:hypothetical protein
MSCVKNLEYNVPRYMKSLEKMNEKLLIQDKIVAAQPQSNVVNLSKINLANYLNHLQDQQIDLPTPHKLVLEMKKNTAGVVVAGKYHQLVAQLHLLMDEAMLSQDVRVLKEVVYFGLSVKTVVGLPGEVVN